MTDVVEERAEPASVPGETVLEARDLRVWYGTERGPVRAVDGVTLRHPGGRDPRDWSASPVAASPPSAAA